MEHPVSLYLRGFVGSIYTEDGRKQQGMQMKFTIKGICFTGFTKKTFPGFQQLTALYQLENPADDDTGNMDCHDHCAEPEICLCAV